jgi:hypothetical protein
MNEDILDIGMDNLPEGSLEPGSLELGLVGNLELGLEDNLVGSVGNLALGLEGNLVEGSPLAGW